MISNPPAMNQQPVGFASQPAPVAAPSPAMQTPMVFQLPPIYLNPFASQQTPDQQMNQMMPAMMMQQMYYPVQPSTFQQQMQQTQMQQQMQQATPGQQQLDSRMIQTVIRNLISLLSQYIPTSGTSSPSTKPVSSQNATQTYYPPSASTSIPQSVGSNLNTILPMMLMMMMVAGISQTTRQSSQEQFMGGNALITAA